METFPRIFSGNFLKNGFGQGTTSVVPLSLRNARVSASEAISPRTGLLCSINAFNEKDEAYQ
jgi:hypothetical protein